MTVLAGAPDKSGSRTRQEDRLRCVRLPPSQRPMERMGPALSESRSLASDEQIRPNPSSNAMRCVFFAQSPVAHLTVPEAPLPTYKSDDIDSDLRPHRMRLAGFIGRRPSEAPSRIGSRRYACATGLHSYANARAWRTASTPRSTTSGFIRSA